MLPRNWFRREIEQQRVEPPLKTEPTPDPHRRSMPRMGMPTGIGSLFEAATTDRLTAGWTSTPVDVDDIVSRHQVVLVARAREQVTNNDYVIRFVQLLEENIIGESGIQLQAQPRETSGAIDRAAADAIEAAWRKWGEKGNCDVSGQLTWRGIQEACIRAAAIDGEFMLRIVPGEDASPLGFGLQVIDPVRCPVGYEVKRLTGGNFIRHGIEMNQYGRPVAYYFVGLTEEETGYRFGSRTLVRVPAEEILHGFSPLLTNQKRGFPWVSTALMRLRMIGQYEQATLVNARITASKGGFFQWTDNNGPEPDEDQGSIDMVVEPGTFRELPAGVEFKEFNPVFPHGEYAIFHKAQLRGIASGLGVAYHSLANDLTDVSYSSVRTGALSEQDHYRKIQGWLIEHLHAPVYRRWLQRSLLAGQIVLASGAALPASKMVKYERVQWQARRWQWVDPRADAEANIKSKNNLLQSPSNIIRDQGKDPESVWREIAADIQAMKDAGIPEEFIKGAINDQMGKSYTEGTGNDGNSDQAASNNGTGTKKA